MLYVRVFSINIYRMKANLYAMHGWYEICLEKNTAGKEQRMCFDKTYHPHRLKTDNNQPFVC